jgi:hypothetical protein
MIAIVGHSGATFHSSCQPGGVGTTHTHVTLEQTMPHTNGGHSAVHDAATNPSSPHNPPQAGRYVL